MREGREEIADEYERATLLSRSSNNDISSLHPSQELVIENSNGSYFHGILFMNTSIKSCRYYSKITFRTNTSTTKGTGMIINLVLS